MSESSYILSKSNLKTKKYMVYTPNGKTIQFGAAGYEDYTIHMDDKRKQRYLNRHKNEDWNDLNKAGTWSRYILWNIPSIHSSIKDMENKFNIKIVIDTLK